MNVRTPTQTAEAIGIFFPVVGEEVLAIRVARLLAELVPDFVSVLRPETTLTQIFDWAKSNRTDTVRFVDSLERELGIELDEFIDDFDHTTFRELVEYAARHQSRSG